MSCDGQRGACARRADKHSRVSESAAFEDDVATGDGLYLTGLGTSDENVEKRQTLFFF